MNPTKPFIQAVSVAVLLTCSAIPGFASPCSDAESPQQEGPQQEAPRKVPTPSDPSPAARTIIAQTAVPVALPLYIPPSRGQVRIRSSAATRGSGLERLPVVAASNL